MLDHRPPCCRQGLGAHSYNAPAGAGGAAAAGGGNRRPMCLLLHGTDTRGQPRLSLEFEYSPRGPAGMQQGWARAVAAQLAATDLLGDAQVLAALQALRARQEP